MPTKRKTNASEANDLAWYLKQHHQDSQIQSIGLFHYSKGFAFDMASMIKQQSLSFVADSDGNASSIKPGSQAHFDDHFGIKDIFGRGTMNLMYS